MSSLQSIALGMRRAVAAEHGVCTSPEVAKSRIRFDVAKVLSTTQEVFAGRVRRVVFYGYSGCGKSSAIALTIGELSRQIEACYPHSVTDPRGNYSAWWNNAVVWMDTVALTEESDNTVRGHGEGLLFARAKAAKVLALDGLGSEKSRYGDHYSIVAAVLRHRLRDMDKITLVGTSLRPEELVEKYTRELARKLVDPHDPTCVCMGTFAEPEEP